MTIATMFFLKAAVAKALPNDRRASDALEAAASDQACARALARDIARNPRVVEAVEGFAL